MGESFVVRSLTVVIVFGLVAAGLIGAGAAQASAKCRPSWGEQPPNMGSGPNDLRGVAVTSACNAWAVGYYNNGTANQTLIEHWSGKAWKVQPSPNPGGSSSDNELDRVAATSPNNAWAVGYYNDGSTEQTLIEHWNGKAWKAQTSPDPGGSDTYNSLYAVSAASPTDAWAVGQTSTQTLIEHWNGRAWKVQTSPNPGGAGHVNGKFITRQAAGLFGVAATSSKHAWAVGFDNHLGYDRTLVERWNGNAWKLQKSPDRGGAGNNNELFDVSAASPSDAWAVGYYVTSSSTPQRTLVEHWNGKAWKPQPSPNPGGSASTNVLLLGVAATSSKNAWAVGNEGNLRASSDPGMGNYGNLSETSTPAGVVEHWNGTAWKIQPSFNPGFSSLFGVAASSSRNVWAVGDYNNGSEDQALALHCC